MNDHPEPNLRTNKTHFQGELNPFLTASVMWFAEEVRLVAPRGRDCQGQAGQILAIGPLIGAPCPDQGRESEGFLAAIRRV